MQFTHIHTRKDVYKIKGCYGNSITICLHDCGFFFLVFFPPFQPCHLDLITHKHTKDMYIWYVRQHMSYLLLKTSLKKVTL